MTVDVEAWIRNFARLALRIEQCAGAEGVISTLIYTGPASLREEVVASAPPDAGKLVDECERLLSAVPLDGARGRYVESQLWAMEAVLRQLTGEPMEFETFATRCLALDIERLPDSVFADARDQLDAALPPGPGSVADRLHGWQRSCLAPDDGTLVAACRRALDECWARTRRLVAEMPELEVDVVLDPGANRGHYAGGGRGTMYIGSSEPFNLADLLYVVAHEAFPGHIAESAVKDEQMIGRSGWTEQHVRFMTSPSFVVSEGLGLHAERLIFPDGDAARWLRDHVPIIGDTILGDLDAIHDARSALWGVWGNAAIMAAHGDPADEIGAYLTRWGLLTDVEATWAVNALTAPGTELTRPYFLTYYHGWRLVGPWLDGPATPERLRRLLTEPLLPADLS